MLDTVRVSADTFKRMMFMGASARREFTQDRRPANEKPQKVTSDGTPLWSVQVAAVNWRGAAQLLTVTVPMHGDPTEKFDAGVPVVLGGLVFGVTAKREGGYVTWCSADDLSAVANTAAVAR